MAKTIAAISTPAGTGGISIVRMTGDKTLAIINEIFRPINKRPIDPDKDNRYLRYGHIIGNDGEIVDEVMVAFMKAPATYTREDVCEINCHGSFVAVREILNLLLDKGADLAEPGEFTKRAFLNGRIDLSQAEAVLDIINSTNKLSASQGISQLQGSLTKKIREIRTELKEGLARLEYSINFTEDGEDLPVSDITAYIKKAQAKIDELASTLNKGKLVKDEMCIRDRFKVE